MNNENNSFGSMIVALLKIILIGVLAIMAKRNTFTRPFYWFVIIWGSVTASIGLVSIIKVVQAVLFDFDSLAAENVFDRVLVVIALLLLTSILPSMHKAMEEVEAVMYGDVVTLSPIQIVLGFIYGLLLHVLLINELGGLGCF